MRLMALILAGSVASLSGCSGFGCGELGFGLCGSTPGFEVAIDVTAADFNHDGHIDVGLPISRGIDPPGSAGVFLHLSMAGKGYAARVDYPTDRDPYTITSADLDGDGLPDIVTTNFRSDTVSVLLNQTGNPGTFAAPQNLAAVNVNTATVADMNGDGRPDLVIAADSVLVALQEPGTPGTFGPAAALYTNPSGHGIGRLAFGDLNGDGVPDIAAADEDGVQLLFHAVPADAMTIAYTARVFSTSRAGNSPPLAVTDLDGDGRNDLVIADADGGSLVVLLQSPAVAGQFLPATHYGPLSVTAAYAVVVADLNDDGHPDVVTGGSDTVEVFLQDPAHPGSLLAPDVYSVHLGADGVAVADVDEDGRPDIITSSGASSSVQDGVLRTPPGVLYQDPANPGHFLDLQNLQ